jgi:uncharacterized integral membrane protein
MIRKIVKALILIPLAIVIVSLAVANRRLVTVSLDPFDQAHPALLVVLPLYVLILLLVIAGVVIGGLAAWLRQGRWRWRARLAESQARDLSVENDRLKRRDPAGPPAAVAYPPRLTIPPSAG